jgi:hypothetical protein
LLNARFGFGWDKISTARIESSQICIELLRADLSKQTNADAINSLSFANSRFRNKFGMT